MTIRAILKSKGNEVLSISGTATVADAVALLAARRIGALPVIDGGQVQGIFSERDVIYGLARDGAVILSQRVADVMTSAVTVTPDETAMSALSLMTLRRTRHLPVVENDSLIGFVSIGDLVKYRIDRIEADAAAMRDYIQSS